MTEETVVGAAVAATVVRFCRPGRQKVTTVAANRLLAGPRHLDDRLRNAGTTRNETGHSPHAQRPGAAYSPHVTDTEEPRRTTPTGHDLAFARVARLGALL